MPPMALLAYRIRMAHGNLGRLGPWLWEQNCASGWCCKVQVLLSRDALPITRMNRQPVCSCYARACLVAGGIDYKHI